MTRVVLAATLGANYGIYGPAFELGEHAPCEHGSEEYLDSEKYEVRHWDLRPAGQPARPDRAREPHPAREPGAAARRPPAVPRRSTTSSSSAYSKSTRGPVGRACSSWSTSIRTTRSRAGSTLPLDELGLPSDAPYQVHDLLTDARYLWHGPRNYVELDPAQWSGAHLPTCAARVRTRTGLRLLQADRTADVTRSESIRRPPTRSGTRTRSSTSCTSAPSPTATATASATSAG